MVKKFPAFKWNLEFNYHFHKIWPLFWTRWMHYTSPKPCFLKIHFKIKNKRNFTWRLTCISVHEHDWVQNLACGIHSKPHNRVEFLYADITTGSQEPNTPLAQWLFTPYKRNITGTLCRLNSQILTDARELLYYVYIL